MIDFNKITDAVRGVDNIVFDKKLSSDFTVKNEADYVTETDFAVQEYLRKALSEIYPSAEFVSEENKDNKYDAKAVWILDPIDGTTNLMHGFGLSAVSLALYEGGKGVFGAVYNPFHKEMFTAVRNGGAFLNGQPIHCAERRRIKDCLANTETAPYYKETSGLTFEINRQLFLRCRDIRTLGSAALGLVYLAAGRADIFLSRNLKPWDHAAADIIIEEAGGMVSDFYGKPLKIDCVMSEIACVPGVSRELLEFTSVYAESV